MGATACDLQNWSEKKKGKYKEIKPQRKKKNKKQNKKDGENLTGYSPHVHVPLVFSHAHLIYTM